MELPNNIMGYRQTLGAAGANVVAFKQFGSYQGDWWAKVGYNGEMGWVHGSYGSCSECDAFHAEFDYNEEPFFEKGKYYKCEWSEEEITEQEYNEAKEKHNTKMKEFGKRYLITLYTQEQAENLASENLEWDTEAQGMLDFIKDNKFKVR